VNSVAKKILVATTNRGKLAELAQMLGELSEQIEWLSLRDFSDVSEVVEDGADFAQNARKKAVEYSRATGLWTLADDSGLMVDALGGAPGVKSARFSGGKDKNRTLLDHKNIAKVMKLLEGTPEEKRTAKFVCCLCLASPEKVLIETEGKLEGVIAQKEMGTNGFGYDPIFYIPRLGKTAAQLQPELKNTVSHRGQAIAILKPLMLKLLSER